MFIVQWFPPSSFCRFGNHAFDGHVIRIITLFGFVGLYSQLKRSTGDAD